MTKNKKRTAEKPRVEKLADKVRNDGKQIAALEQSAHNLKGTIHGKAKNLEAGYGVLPRLLSSREEQETAWLLTILDCREYDSRIPTSQVVGAVPVDLYRKTEVAAPIATAAGECWIMTQCDCWSKDQSVYNALLHADSEADTAYGTYTNGSYAGSTFPAYAVLPAGAISMNLGDVSSDFVSNANTGTEYVQVAKITVLRSLGVPAAAADAGFSGRVQVFYTLDPQRHPIVGKSAAALEAESYQQNSMVSMMEYVILRDGRFVPVGGEYDGMEPLTEIKVASLPLSTDAYKWRRIGDVNQSSSLNAVNVPDVGFYIAGVASAKYEVETTYLWQTERYATNRIISMDEDTDSLPGFAAEVQDWDGRPYPPMAIPANLNGNAFVACPSTPTCPQPTPKSAPKTAAHTAQHGEPVPPVVNHLASAVFKTPGLPVHPSVAPAAVLGNFASRPGMHRQLTRELAGDPGALDNIVADRKVARQLVKDGPAAAANQHKRSWSWKSVLKGIWDVAKVVGPAVMALL